MEEAAGGQERRKRSGQADHAAAGRLLDSGRLGGNALKIFETFRPVLSHGMIGAFGHR